MSNETAWNSDLSANFFIWFQVSIQSPRKKLQSSNDGVAEGARVKGDEIPVAPLNTNHSIPHSPFVICLINWKFLYFRHKGIAEWINNLELIVVFYLLISIVNFFLCRCHCVILVEIGRLIYPPKVKSQIYPPTHMYSPQSFKH